MIKKALEYFFVKVIFQIVKPAGGIIFRYFILPIYGLVVLTKLRIQRLALPARGFVLFLITNKYLFHIAIVLAATASIFANVQNRQVLAQDAGQHSLLYTIMTKGESEVVREDLYLQDVKPNEKILGAGTIEAIPHVDFDYNWQDDSDNNMLATLPGTVVMYPIDEGGLDGQQNVKPNRASVESYVVKAGDTLGSIARDFDIDVGTILWANNLTERQYIRPGDALRILPVSGVMVTVAKGDTLSGIAKKYGSDLNEIMRANQLTDEIVPVGKELIIPGGEPPRIEQERIIAVSRRAIESASRETLVEPGATQQNAPVTDAVVTKPKDLSEVSTSPKTKLLWPTSGHVITQYFSWRHTGLDIDGDFTSPLYAAEDGIVTVAGWNNGGYGLMVFIDHPNGMKTRYAHASKLFVKAGDQVKRGQAIAMMGSTGRSTGSHLHFEVYVGGKRVNPLLYIR